ncbi:MAG: hypothetical protein AAF721_39920, partial [Myxococcota bacterium]
MLQKRHALWIGLGLAAGCYAGVEDAESDAFDRTDGACRRLTMSRSASSYQWNCNGGSQAQVREGGLAPAVVVVEGPTE